MNAIDSVLNLLVQQDGTELWLLSERRPKMFRDDVELPLTIPAMSAEQIRALLDDLWTVHQADLASQGRLSVSYTSPELGRFTLRLVQPEETALEVYFRREAVAPRPPGAALEAGPRPAAQAAAAAPPELGNALPAALVGLLARVAERGASDIHLSPHGAPVVRVNGALEVLDGETGVDATVLLAGQAHLDQIYGGGSVDRALDIPGVGRVRINVYASDAGLCAAVRFLRRAAPSLAELGLPAQLGALIDLPHGLIIACGPTGSGKSSTLAALLQHALRARAQVLVTIEDPIEYILQPMHPAGLVRQREVGTHVRDFAGGLRDALREDPDLLLIGEMRDAETISLALTAAETGHLVFTTLHSRTAISAVERIVDTYPPERQRQIRVQLADALRAVISQRLVPTADGSGRVPAVELLRVNAAVANLIRDGRTPQIANALQAGAGEGMLVLERSLADLVRANRIRRETALGSANDASTLAEYLRATA